MGLDLYPLGSASSFVVPPLKVTSLDSVNDILVASGQYTYHYASTTSTYHPYVLASNRLSTLLNNHDSVQKVLTTVPASATGSYTTGSPVSTLPPIVDCGLDTQCNFYVPASDPARHTITYRMSTSLEMGGTVATGTGAETQPPGSAIDATTGLYSFHTTTAAGLWSTQVMVETHSGDATTPVLSSTAVDFLIRVSSSTTDAAPVFDGSTPADGSHVQGSVGNALTVPVHASDPNSSDVVTLSALGLPSGATLTATPGNPSSGAITLVPTVPGQFPVNIVATDQSGVTATRSIVLDIAKLVPHISWSAPAQVTYGTALGAGQLDASMVESDATGGIAYFLADGTTPAAGAVLHAGSAQTLIASYTPDAAAAGTYAPTSLQTTIDVGQAPQTITVADPGTHAFGDPAFTLSATGGGSNNPVTFASSTPDVCTTTGATGATVTIINAGDCEVTASQAGNADYSDAAPLVVPITLAKKTPQATWTVPSPDNIQYGDPLGTSGARLDPPAGVNGVISYSLADGTPVTMATILAAGDGQVVNGTFTPTGADADDYIPVTVPLTVNVAKIPGAIAMTLPAQLAYGSAPQALDLSWPAGETQAPTLVSIDQGVCTVAHPDSASNPYLVSVVGVGPCQLQAYDKGDSNYLPGQTDVQTITVTRGQPSLSWTALQHVGYGDPLEIGEQLAATIDPQPNAPVPPAGHIDYSYGAGIEALGATPHAGSYVVHAHFVPDDAALWNDAGADSTIVVDKATPVLSFPSVNATYGSALRAGQELAASVDPSSIDSALTGTFTYTLDNGANADGATPDAGDHTLTADFTPDASFAVDFTTASATAPLHVVQAPQSITLGPIGSHHYGDAPFTVTATGGGSGNPVVLTPSSGSTCRTDRVDPTHTTVTITAAGGCQLTATQAGNDNYLDASPVQAAFTSDKEVTSLSWAAPATLTYGTPLPAEDLAATLDQAGVAGTVAYTEGAAAVAPGAVLDAGDHTLTATFTPGDGANYYGSTATVTLHVDQATQTIAFAKPDDRTYGDGPFGVTATGGDSGNPVTFTSGTPDVCTTDSTGQVTILAAGDCTLTANQAGTPDYVAADPVSRTFTVAKAAQFIHVTDPGNHTFGDQPFGLSATGGASSMPVTFASNTTGVCTVAGATVSIVHAGDCTLTASQLGTPNYAAAPDVTVTFAVAKADQHLDLAAVGDHTYGDAPFDLAVTSGGSSAPPQLSLRAGDPCSLTGISVAISGAGTCQVTATQAGDGDWNDATPVTRTFTIAKAIPTVSWNDPTATTYGAELTAAQLSATVTPSTIAGTLAYTDSDGTPVHAGDVLHAGTHTITATFTPTGTDAANWNGASTRATVAVDKAGQTITFAEIPAHTYGDAPFTVSASGGASGNPVTFGAAPPCTAGGSPAPDATTVTITGAGSCDVTASQSGNGDFFDASPVTRRFDVAKATPSLAWATPGDLAYGHTLDSNSLDAHVTSSGVTGSFSYLLPDGTDASGATLDAGAYKVTATFTPDAASAANWTTASTVVTVTIDKATQQLGFTQLPDATFGDGPFTLTATKGASGEPVTFTATGGCTVDGLMLTITHAGSCAVTAAEDGNRNWQPSPDVTQTFAIAKAAQAIAFAAPPAATFGDAPFALPAAGGGSHNPVTFSATGTACSVTPAGTVTVLAAGTCDISADQAGNDDYTAAPTVTRTLTVGKAAQTIGFTLTGTRTYGDPPFAVTGTATSGLPVTFTAGGACTVASGTVTLTGVGTCSVTAHQSGNGNWQAAPDVTRSVDVTYATALGFDNTKATKVPATIPVKVVLTNAGKDISAAAITLGSVTLDGKPAPYPGTSQTGETFTYMGSSPTGGSYQFNVKTDGLLPGAHTLAYSVTGDPDLHSVTLYIR